MSFFIGWAAVFILLDAFSAHHFGVRQEWETATAFVFILAACIVYWASGGDD